MILMENKKSENFNYIIFLMIYDDVVADVKVNKLFLIKYLKVLKF